MTTLAIMQPTFIPWLGFFALMHQADDFIFLDDVQFSKQSWQSRNRIKGPNGPVTIPLGVNRDKYKPMIADVELAKNGFERKILKTAQGCLGKCPHFDLVHSILERAFSDSQGSLSRLNRAIIVEVADCVGIKTRLHLASELAVRSGEKTERLLAFSEHFEATTYLSPVGSSDYLKKENPFDKSDVNLRFVNFTHPEYPQQHPPFVSHMGIIDVLANVGAEGVISLINGGLGPPLNLSDV